jgi:hypothetical protein
MMVLRFQGASYQDIGDAAGLSRQRIQQILQPPAAIRQHVLRQAGERCQRCSVASPSLHIHHRGSVGMTPDLYEDVANLEALCLVCHLHAHAPETPPPVVRPPRPTVDPEVGCPTHPHTKLVSYCPVCRGRAGGLKKSERKASALRQSGAKRRRKMVFPDW